MPIGMTPNQYFEAFVQGNYDDYIANRYCVRRAFNAAISASHMADHYFKYYKKHDNSKVSQFNTIGDFVNHISNNTNEFFKDIRSIANAYKHLYTGDNQRYSQHSSISSAGTIETIQLTDGDIQDVSEESSIVVYTRKSGQQLDFHPALETVIKYWEQEFPY